MEDENPKGSSFIIEFESPASTAFEGVATIADRLVILQRHNRKASQPILDALVEYDLEYEMLGSASALIVRGSEAVLSLIIQSGVLLEIEGVTIRLNEEVVGITPLRGILNDINFD